MTFIEFLPNQKYSAKGADVSDTLDSFQDAGYMLTDNDLVVDIDDIGKPAIKAMLSAFNVNTHIVWTDRGAHLYFKRPQGFRRAQGVCALGFKVEYKHANNTLATLVKSNGVAREIENEGIRETLPWYLETKKNYKPLQGMSEGDGRNNALYSLKRSMAAQSGWKAALKFINRYIFAEPLSDEEMEILCREEAIPLAEKEGEYLVADYLIRDLDYLKYSGSFYYKERGEDDYKNDESRLLQLIYKLCPAKPTRYVDEVKKQMEYRCRKVPNNTVFKIRLNNGYLHNGEFVPIRISEFTPYTLRVDYDPDTEPVKVVDDYIDHLTNSDPDYRKFLMEVLGHTLIVNPEVKRLLAKFFIFIGSGGNGKGTLLTIIKGILGAHNVTGMGIKELSDDRHLTSLKGKLANLGDDIQDSSINNKDMKVLKNISTCDFMSTRELYKQAESVYFTATLIFTSNHLIKSFEKGKSYKRRVTWLPMFTEVEEGKKDPFFITKLTSPESIRYWIKLIVEGYQRLYQNKGFTQSDIVDSYNVKYHRENNPYLDYIEDIKPDDLIGVPVRDGYNACKAWCSDNGIEYNQKMYRATLLEVYGIDTDGQKRINGSKAKVFRKVDK